jgi:hypothetical protein
VSIYLAQPHAALRTPCTLLFSHCAHAGVHVVDLRRSAACLVAPPSHTPHALAATILSSQVLTSAGNIKRAQLEAARKKLTDAGEAIDDNKLAAEVDEQAVVIESVSNTMIPKLVADDIPLLDSLMQVRALLQQAPLPYSC